MKITMKSAMKRFYLVVGACCALLFSTFLPAGEPLRSLGNRDHDAQPDSSAFGMTLDGWMTAYIRWLEADADPAARVRNVAFLPIIGESPFEVEVEPGTALVLPILTWLGFPEDPKIPDEWWGDRNHIFGDVWVDGQPVAVPNEDYYVGPTDLDPPAQLFGFEIDYYQALVVVIKPLTPGEHQVVLHSEFVDYGAVYDNVWNITVRQPARAK